MTDKKHKAAGGGAAAAVVAALVVGGYAVANRGGECQAKPPPPVCQKRQLDFDKNPWDKSSIASYAITVDDNVEGTVYATVPRAVVAIPCGPHTIRVWAYLNNATYAEKPLVDQVTAKVDDGC